MRTYKVLLPLLVHLTEEEGGGSYAQGETFKKDFTADDERANLESGLLELQPSTYKVLGSSEVDGHAQGDEFEAAIPLGREALLIEGGHIERVEKKPAPKARKKKEE
jgi:hypothetical protein